MSKKLAITERQFSSQVEHLLKLFGWEFYHVFEQQTYARRTSRGFPDYVAARPPRLIFAELKSETGKVTEDQEKWLDILRGCRENIGQNIVKNFPEVYIWEVYIWRPSDIEKIAEILK